VSIDLHIHSTASDGSLTPSEILTLAQQLDLRAIAITDHDTLEGAKEVLRCGLPSSIHFLTGVEISTQAPTDIPLSGSAHILGYGIDVNDQSLFDILKKLQISRANRNPEIIGRLQACGLSLTYDELVTAFQGVQIGRPHIAQLMKKKGYVGSIGEAFDRYLSTGEKAYVDKYRVDCLKSLKVIQGAGGLPVLAHPGLLKLSEEEMISFVGLLKEEGLMGIEVYYPEHSPKQTAYFKSLANRFDLLLTGGTDFHGEVVPNIQIGIGAGDFHVPYSVYEKMHQALS
jgi:3',5'-nucleoside bisphosphate phosphatase